MRDDALHDARRCKARAICSMSPPIIGCGRAIPGEIERNNLEGAQATMEAALKAGVERVVYTSSVAALKPGRAMRWMKLRAIPPQSAIGVYKRSKLMAEREVERLIAEEELPAVIVAPSTPIGPRDIKPTPTGRIIVEAARGAHAGLCRYRAQSGACG